MQRKGVSPVIATVLLISIVVVIAAIIFIWAISFIGEVVQKSGQSAEQACTNLDLQASLSGTELSVINRGEIPIFKINVLGTLAGSTRVEKFTEPISGGGAQVYTLSDAYESVEIVPILLGKVKNSKQEYTCSEPIEVE